jgi:protein-L-isoaspartate O-methyltransferase
MTDEQRALRAYYRDRAGEYDEVYAKPERQSDLGTLRGLLARWVRDKSVLEIAAGTGYWTEVLASSARNVVATDVNNETLGVARARTFGCPVEFFETDAYSLVIPDRTYEVVFVGFFWSHVAHRDIGRFLDHLHSLLDCGTLVIVLDNTFVEGSSTPISRTDAWGNSYQRRELIDGKTYEVLKNFPSDEELRTAMSDIAEDVKLRRLTYYWLMTYRVFRA